jgi:hypothetical protein
MGIALLWILLNLISGLVTGTFFDASAPTLIDIALNPTILTSVNPTNLALGQMQGLNPLSTLWTALWQALSFDYPFFTGFYVIFRWIFCVLSLGFLWGIFQVLFSAVSRFF